MTESRRSTAGEQGTERGSYRYLYLLQPDGIGTQFVYISLLLDYARKAGCALIVDFSNMALFPSAGAVCGERELADVVSFTTDTIIYRKAEIDRIVREEGDVVLGVAFYEANSSLTKRQPFPSVCAGELFPMLPGPERARASHDLPLAATYDEQFAYFTGSPAVAQACRYLRDRLTLNGDYRRRFRDYQARTAGALGVHARFGNGEERSVASRDRFDVPWEQFFTLMDAASEERLFVCTDAPDFLQECLRRYGHRVVRLDRYMSPRDCGPGHNTWSIQAGEDLRERYLAERRRTGPYRLLGEALIEMLLLGECERLVCSKSFFSHYAREACNVESVILE